MTILIAPVGHAENAPHAIAILQPEIAEGAGPFAHRIGALDLARDDNLVRGPQQGVGGQIVEG